MSGSNTTIRFKRGDCELEVAGSEAVVGRAWTVLESSIVEAFTGASHTKPSDRAASDAVVAVDRKKTASKKRLGSRTDERRSSDVQQRLLNARLDSFPDLGKNPPPSTLGTPSCGGRRKNSRSRSLLLPTSMRWHTSLASLIPRMRTARRSGPTREPFTRRPRDRKPTSS